MGFLTGALSGAFLALRVAVAATSSHSIIADILAKYSASQDLSVFCPSLDACINEVRSWSAETAAALTPAAAFEKLLNAFQPGLDEAEKTARSRVAARWLHAKYGLLDQPILRRVSPDSGDGSYRSRGQLKFRYSEARLPEAFDPSQESSIQDLDEYITRKWGGLDGITTPDRVLVSELGTNDTLLALKQRGFERIHLVNAPYSMRGSKTLIAFKDGEPPLLVLHSFVGRDLFQHKLMQLSLWYKSDFSKIRILSSNNLKSWEVADLVVTKALLKLPETPIDDLVIGYTDVVGENLKKRARFIEKTKIGDFATIEYYAVKGKNGFERTIGLLTDVELRYFGRSALTLVKPFLNRGIDRVLFAGSAGVLDPAVPLHALVIPKTLVNLDDQGRLEKRVPLFNDLFNMLPYGVGHSGTHLSVQSPLVESKEMIRRLRDRDGILSVDVEGAKLAALVASHNRVHGTQIRFGAAFIVTDTPVAAGEPPKDGYGLHRPDFGGKASAKNKYVSALNLMWEVPDKFAPSNHARLVSAFYADQIHELARDGNTVALAILYAEIQSRIEALEGWSKADLRVSQGLIKALRDLTRALDKQGVTPLTPEYLSSIDPVERPKAIDQGLQRVLLLQSLARSSTLSSGDVRYDTGQSAHDVREKALRGAERAVELVLSTSGRALTESEIHELHRRLNDGVLPDADRGRIRSYNYSPFDGGDVASAEVFAGFVKWYREVPPSPESALEAYVRFEHLHPYKDGNGRVAELLAQHLMLRSSGHPFILPNRFDIDYILSLKRNGSSASANHEYLEALLDDATAFSGWLGQKLPAGDSLSAGFASDGSVYVMTPAGRAVIRPFFRSRRPIRLEREKRAFLSEGERPRSPVAFAERLGGLERKRRQFDVFYELYREPDPGSVFDTSRHYSDGHGRYSQERAVLHESIIERLLKQGRSSDRPRLVLMGGPSGAGKTTVIRMLAEQGHLDLDEFLTLDVDYIKTLLPEYEGFQRLSPEQAAPAVHKESGHIQGLLYERALKLRKNMIVDGTLVKTDVYVRTLGELKREHPEYAVAIVFVDASLETLFVRVRKRAEATGRHVPDDFVKESKSAVRGSIHVLRDLVDRVFEIESLSQGAQGDQVVLRSIYGGGAEFLIDQAFPLQDPVKKILTELLRSPGSSSCDLFLVAPTR